MKRRKILMFFAGIVSLLFVLTSCTVITVDSATLQDAGFESVFEVNSKLDLTNLSVKAVYSNGRERTVEVTPVMVSNFDSSTVGLKEMYVKFGTFEYVVIYRVVEKLYLEVTFVVEDTDQQYPSQTVKWGELATRPANDPVSEVDEFEDWYLGDYPFSFSTPVTDDITLVGRFELSIGEVRDNYYTATEDVYNNLIQAMYPEGFTVITDAYVLALDNITNAMYRDDIKGYYDEFVSLVNAQPTYVDYLTTAFEAYDADDYFEAEYAQLVQIYEDALANLTNYVGGAPLPQYIYLRTLEDMEDVVTKAEDIALAAAQVSWYSNDLANLEASIIRELYSSQNQAIITDIFANAQADLLTAVGTKALHEVYTAAVNAIYAVEKLVTADNILELYNYFNALDETLYFAQEWQMIVEIYENALDLLTYYIGGAPMPAYIVLNAIADIEDVVTIAEDLALIPVLLLNKEKHMDAIIASFDLELYTDAGLAELQNIKNDILVQLANCNGSRELELTYVTLVDALYQVEQSAYALQVLALRTLVEGFNEAEYTPENWANVVYLYETYAHMLCNYDDIETDKTVEELLEEAIVALTAVEKI